MKVVGVIFIGLTIACCAQQPSPQQKVERSVQQNSAVQRTTTYDEDYGTPYKDNCLANLYIQLSKNWSFDSLDNRYLTNRNFTGTVTFYYYPCLQQKDSTLISQLFGKYYTYTRDITNTDSITYKLSYKTNERNLDFCFINSKLQLIDIKE